MFWFQIKEIGLSGINFDDEKAAKFSTCVHNIEVLNVSECELTNNGIDYIANAIKLRNTPVTNWNWAFVITKYFNKSFQIQ